MLPSIGNLSLSTTKLSDESPSDSTNSVDASRHLWPPAYPFYVEEHFVPMPGYTCFPDSNYTGPTSIPFQPSSENSPPFSNGISFIECLSMIGLSDPDAILFYEEWTKGRVAIKFVLKWPGYEHVIWENEISIFGANGGLITRKELAFKLVSHFQDFVAACDYQDIHTTDPQWRVGTNGYDIHSMSLSGLWSTADGIWQASVRVRSNVL